MDNSISYHKSTFLSDIQTWYLEPHTKQWSQEDTNILDSFGFTKLMIAAYSGQENIVRSFIKKKCIINLMNSRGDTALTRAIEGGHDTIVKLLINAGATISARDIILALHSNFIIQKLIEEELHRNVISRWQSEEAKMTCEKKQFMKELAAWIDSLPDPTIAPPCHQIQLEK